MVVLDGSKDFKELFLRSMADLMAKVTSLDTQFKILPVWVQLLQEDVTTWKQQKLAQEGRLPIIVERTSEEDMDEGLLEIEEVDHASVRSSGETKAL